MLEYGGGLVLGGEVGRHLVHHGGRPRAQMALDSGLVVRRAVFILSIRLNVWLIFQARLDVLILWLHQVVLLHRCN